MSTKFEAEDVIYKNANHGDNPKGNFKPETFKVPLGDYIYSPTAFFEEGVL